mmetsp:Transcript_5797/g.7275  ORF Transcript_5797/g.7275 Transcript_5797/m.7275 type:complete len:279 (-) Transcript_5797:63-899(-)
MARLKLTVRRRKKFFCYLVVSKNPRFSKATYIGFTMNPSRRIRQHNGEIVNGAWKTSRKRPWAFAVVIEGFPTKISALQFEWAWQNPNKHRGVKKDLPTNIHKKPGCGPKFQILGMLLKSTPWSQYTLSLHFLNIKMRDTFLDATSYMIGMGDFCRISPLENLHDKSLDEEEESASCKENGMDEQGESGKNLVFEEQKRVDFLDSCDICQNDLVGSIINCPLCQAEWHVECLAKLFLFDFPEQLLPRHGNCPSCTNTIQWGNVIRSLRSVTVETISTT